MKTRKLAFVAAALTLFAAGAAFADDFDAPDQSGGNTTAHVSYDPGTDPAPAPPPRPVETQTVMLRMLPFPVPARLPVPQDRDHTSDGN